MPAVFRLLLLCGITSCCALSLSAERMRLAWPTPNTAYARGAPLEEFIQPTVSGRVESGLFGCVRSSGWQFHEALDLFPIKRDAQGESLDEVFTVADGIVRHVSSQPGLSSYGRYVVVEHVDAKLPVMTLYAHLASIAPGIRDGTRVKIGDTLGILGRSAGARPLPKERAHLHFEIGVRLTDRFASWYKWKGFGSKNTHGIWNGMNLVGIDPLAFYDAFRAEEVDNFLDFWRTLEPVVTVRIATTKTPDFVKRYPALRPAPMPLRGFGGWEVDFDAYGVPIEWRPLREEEVADYRRNEVRVVSFDAASETKCKDLVETRAGRQAPDSDLQTNLQLLFGLRN
jgi:peptidoglycan LD-endopeptidase LytH